MNKFLKLQPLALAAAVIAGCYHERWTGNFDQFPDINEMKSAIVDETGLTESQKKANWEFLKAQNEAPDEIYHINAGDTISIIVYDHADLKTTTTVTPDGKIGMVFVGDVEVGGLTLAEASKRIEERLRDYIKEPVVALFTHEIASQTASIVGAVRKPGLYKIYNGMRLSDLYADAGASDVRDIDGQWLDVADLLNAKIIRNGRFLPVDFFKAINEGDPVHNVKLRKGDYVYIGSRTESMVCLIGDVANPHKRIWDPSLGLLEIMTTGGWVNETYWPYAIIIRGGVADPKIYKVDVDAILTGRAANVMMLPGDVVYVPHDNASEYNVFVRKLFPTAQLIGTLAWPFTMWSK